MNTANVLGQINFLVVLVAALSSFVVGSLWYGQGAILGAWH